MDIRKIKKLIEMLEASGIAELEITEGEESVRINRYGQVYGDAWVRLTTRGKLLVQRIWPEAQAIIH